MYHTEVVIVVEVVMFSRVFRRLDFFSGAKDRTRQDMDGY